MSNRDTQFQGFAKALVEDLFRFHALDARAFVSSGHKIEQIVARRAYDFEAHTVGHTLEYLRECGREMPGSMKTRIVPSIPDMTELPKEQE